MAQLVTYALYFLFYPLGWLCFCGSSVAVPISSSLLLDDVWGYHAQSNVGGWLQQTVKEMVALSITRLGWVYRATRYTGCVCCLRG